MAFSKFIINSTLSTFRIDAVKLICWDFSNKVIKSNNLAETTVLDLLIFLFHLNKDQASHHQP